MFLTDFIEVEKEGKWITFYVKGRKSKDPYYLFNQRFYADRGESKKVRSWERSVLVVFKFRYK